MRSPRRVTPREIVRSTLLTTNNTTISTSVNSSFFPILGGDPHQLHPEQFQRLVGPDKSNNPVHALPPNSRAPSPHRLNSHHSPCRARPVQNKKAPPNPPAQQKGRPSCN